MDELNCTNLFFVKHVGMNLAQRLVLYRFYAKKL